MIIKKNIMEVPGRCKHYSFCLNNFSSFLENCDTCGNYERKKNMNERNLFLEMKDINQSNKNAIERIIGKELTPQQYEGICSQYNFYCIKLQKFSESMGC